MPEGELRITEHIGQQYTRRYIGEDGFKAYYIQNKERIDESIKKMFLYSELFYTGKVGNNPVSNFYKNGNNCMVVDKNNTALVTIFKFDFGTASDDANLRILDILLEDLKDINEQYEQTKENNEERIAEFQCDIMEEEQRISDYKDSIEESKNRIESFKAQLKVRQNEIEAVKKKVNRLQEQIVGKGLHGK